MNERHLKQNRANRARQPVKTCSAKIQQSTLKDQQSK